MGALACWGWSKAMELVLEGAGEWRRVGWRERRTRQICMALSWVLYLTSTITVGRLRLKMRTWCEGCEVGGAEALGGPPVGVGDWPPPREGTPFICRAEGGPPPYIEVCCCNWGIASKLPDSLTLEAPAKGYFIDPVTDPIATPDTPCRIFDLKSKLWADITCWRLLSIMIKWPGALPVRCEVSPLSSWPCSKRVFLKVEGPRGPLTPTFVISSVLAC